MSILSFTLSKENASKLLEEWNYKFVLNNRELDLIVEDDSYLYYADREKLHVDVIIKDCNTNTFYKIRGGVYCIRSNNDYIWSQFPLVSSKDEVIFDLVLKVFDREGWEIIENESF